MVTCRDYRGGGRNGELGIGRRDESAIGQSDGMVVKQYDSVTGFEWRRSCEEELGGMHRKLNAG